MQTPPDDLSVDTVAAALAENWNIAAATLTYAPLGYGSHHWIAESIAGVKWFVTVDDLRSAYLAENEEASYQVLETAFRAAVELRDVANLAFVNAPTADGTGGCLRRLGQRYSMAVFPFVEVDPTEFDRFPLASDRGDALRIVGEIHNATSRISTEALRKESFLVPNRAELLEALSDLEAPWNAGPYSEPARLLLQDHAPALHLRLAQFDRLAAEVLADKSDWVVTHGEPHAGNVIRTRSENLVVVDWARVALAPRERDVWMLLDGENPDWSAYRHVTRAESLSDHALTAYRLHWNLSDIAVFVTLCKGLHDQTEEMAMIWAELESYVSRVAFSLCRAG